MRARDRRIRKTADFDRTFKQGAGFKHNGLRLKAMPRTGPTRFGIIVSKKTAKEAVRRNRTRRLVREAVRKHEEELKEGKDAVFVVLPGFQAHSLRDVEPVVEALLQRAGILKRNT